MYDQDKDRCGTCGLTLPCGQTHALTTHKGHPMVRVTYKTGTKKRPNEAWAAKLAPTKGGLLQYLILSKSGEPTRMSTGRNGELKGADIRQILLASPEDILGEKPARLNLKYGEMELVDET